MSEKKLDLIYKFEGSVVDKGINVFELAPILLSLGYLIKEGHNTLNPTGREISINVKPFEKGSFVVDILLFATNHSQQILDFVDGADVAISQVKETLEWIGLISAPSGVTLLELIRRLKEPPKTVEQIAPNEYRYTGGNNISITVNGNVNKLYQNPVIQQNLPRAYEDLFEKTGVDVVRSYLKDKSNETEVLVTKEDSSAFAAYANADLTLTSEFDETEFTASLNPKRGSYEGEGRNWSFRFGGSPDSVITATVKDRVFLDKIERGEIKLHYRDLLKARLRMRQEIRDQQVSSAIYEILEVTEYRPVSSEPRQGSLLS